MIKNRVNCILLFLLLLTGNQLTMAENINIAVRDTVYHRISADFHGIQYHAYTYNDSSATAKLKKLRLKWIRIWADVAEFHPNPDTWDWTELDRKIAEILNLSYEPIVCLYQSEEWFTGSADNPWWNYQDGLTEWEKAADSLASRYLDKVKMFIIFDEINVMHPDQGYYITFQEAAQLYLRAAQKIKAVNPAFLCGGPSGFGGWENGYWADYVLNEPNSANLLDFVSCNLFISWDADDSDDLIMDRTIWYEEAPLKIRTMLGSRCPATLVLDAYNASALWELNGELWTDPRNTNLFGGIYHAAALLHSAKGGYDITLHWETIGGFGILNWYPEFKELPPYYAWQFLIDVAGLANGAEILDCTTSEAPITDIVHHGGMNVNLYRIQPFAVRRSDNGISVILINKYTTENMTATVAIPTEMKSYRLYRFDENHISDCFEPLTVNVADSVCNVTCSPYSVTVIRFSDEEQTAVEMDNHKLSKQFRLYRNYPNPFNPATTIAWHLPERSDVTLQICDVNGRQVHIQRWRRQSAGSHEYHWNAANLTSGIYFIHLKTNTGRQTIKAVLIK